MSAKVTEDSVMAELRCTLVSAKGGVPLAHLQRDYKSVIGQYIPFADLGHKSLENLLRAHPEVVRIVNKNGQQIVEAVVDENLGHIASLVSRQKTTKPTALKSKRGISIRRGGRNFRFSTRGRGRPSTFGHSSSAPYYSSAGSNSFGPSSRSSNVSRDSYSNSSRNVTRSSTERSSNVPQYSEPSAPVQKDLRTVLNERRRNGVPPPSTTSRPKTPPAARPQRETRHPPSRRPRIDMPPRFLRLLQQDLQRSSEPRVRRSPTPKSVEVEQNKVSDTSRASSRTGQMGSRSSATPEVEEEVWETVDTWTATDVETESPSQTHDIPLQTDSIPLQTDSIPSQTDGFLSFIPTDKSSEQKAESTNLHFDATAELTQATTSKEYIEIYARHHNLPIKFSTKMFKSSGFTTKLILGKEEYQTYPDFFKTAEIAEEEASLKAYNDVNKSEGNFLRKTDYHYTNARTDRQKSRNVVHQKVKSSSKSDWWCHDDRNTDASALEKRDQITDTNVFEKRDIVYPPKGEFGLPVHYKATSHNTVMVPANTDSVWSPVGRSQNVKTCVSNKYHSLPIGTEDIKREQNNSRTNQDRDFSRTGASHSVKGASAATENVDDGKSINVARDGKYTEGRYREYSNDVKRQAKSFKDKAPKLTKGRFHAVGHVQHSNNKRFWGSNSEWETLEEMEEGFRDITLRDSPNDVQNVHAAKTDRTRNVCITKNNIRVSFKC